MPLSSWLDTLTLPPFQFDPGGHLSDGYVFDPGGFLKFDPNGFIQSTSASSLAETTGHQHPLFLHCLTEITNCFKFFKVSNLINNVLFCFLHGEQVFDDLPETATSATMAKWINREMDAVPGKLR